MATILAHITVKPGMTTRFEDLATELYRATHATETGVRRYEYWRGSTERAYYALLSFDDYVAFIAHQTSDHHEEASPALGDVIESIRLEWVDPLPEASPLAATKAMALPDDASPLEKRYAKVFSAEVAGWWPSRG